jgi:hypothetical protein
MRIGTQAGFSLRSCRRIGLSADGAEWPSRSYGFRAIPNLIHGMHRAHSFGNPKVAGKEWNHIPSARGGSVENGMETMEIHVLERALTAACIVAVIAVVWWGFKIMAV